MGTATPPIELLHASTDKINVIDIPLRRMLVGDGMGEPGGMAFQQVAEALFAAAYAIAYCHRHAIGSPPRVGPLEGLWWTGDRQPTRDAAMVDLATLPPPPWHWRLMIEIPPVTTDEEVAAVLDAARNSRRPRPGLERLKVIDFEEGLCAQLLHVGAYGKEHSTIHRLEEAAAAQGLRLHGMHHEIYLGDPRRPNPERWRTILRYPVSPMEVPAEVAIASDRR